MKRNVFASFPGGEKLLFAMKKVKEILCCLLLTLAIAHADVMSLNEFMPTRLEDASVLEKGAWQLQGTARFAEEDNRLQYRPSLRWGVMKRLQLEFCQETYSASKNVEVGSGETQAAVQWNFNDQDDWVPSIALASQFTFPTGKKTAGVDPSLKLFLTSTIAGTLMEPIGQIHFNYQHEHNSQRQSGEDKITKLMSLGYSHKLGKSTSLLADLVHEKDLVGHSTNELELGNLYEFSPSWILGSGIALEIHEGHLSYTLAIQKSF